jgi:hypothetical protein
VLDRSLVHVVVTSVKELRWRGPQFRGTTGGEGQMQQRFVRTCSFALGMLVAVHSIGGIALASTAAAVPEIDGSSVSAGLGLLTAGILLVRARKAR